MSEHIIATVKRMIKRRLDLEKYLKEHPCETCAYSRCVSNRSPCYQCRNNNLYEENTGVSEK